ncbi:MAG: hypothetical protein HQ481_04675 [Alphaproteobacteria bacterium]|nr:hypothetical protein [Alphaproteobacteria bacterium]
MKIPFLSRPVTPLTDRRRQQRLRTHGDSYVRVEGRDVPLKNWSEDGLLAGPYAGGLVVGQRAKLRIVIQDFHDRDGPVALDDVSVVIKRIDRSGVAARFHGLERYKMIALKELYARKGGSRIP